MKTIKYKGLQYTQAAVDRDRAILLAKKAAKIVDDIDLMTKALKEPTLQMILKAIADQVRTDVIHLIECK